MSAPLEQAKALIRAKGLEEEFLKAAGLDSLDDLHPKNFSSLQPDVVLPATTAVPVPRAAPVPAPDLKKSAADAPKQEAKPVASDMLAPYLGTSILYASRKKVSSYVPSALMMSYIVHLMNSVLVDNFYFKRYSPDYHPYVLRLYFAVVFIIQVLRAAHDAKQLDPEAHEFLVRFLSNYPPESLPIPGPLVALFKTICTSQPEITSYGKVYPSYPAQPGPATRDHFVANNANILIFPQVPAILALLEHLNSLINATQPTYPKKGKHFPVQAAAVTFGHHAFPAAANRSDLEKWSLICSGLEYPCEADAKLNEAFAERYDNFDFPTTAANDDVSNYYGFTSMSSGMHWFSTVVDVAAAAALYFENSGTLADCSPSGIVSNQLIVEYSTIHNVLPPPATNADKNSLFPFSFRLRTSARSLPALTEVMACMAQTNVQYPHDHPWAADLGLNDRKGNFWNIAPTESSNEDEESWNALPGIVKKLMKSRV